MTLAPVEISIVICTIERSGREDRLQLLVERLQKQLHVDLEIIIVFQGSDPALAPKIPGARYIVTTLISSAESRNRGADAAKHGLLCFFDDDTFPIGDDFLHRACGILYERALDFLTCNISSQGDIQSGPRIEADIPITTRSVISQMWEPGLLIRASAFRAVRFDPTLGIACIHGSSEGFDIGVRLLAAGFRGQRIASLIVDHPPLPVGYNENMERAFFYGLGNGATLVQHKYYLNYGLAMLKTIARLFLSIAVANNLRAKASLVRLTSLIAGPLLPRRSARIEPLPQLGERSDPHKTHMEGGNKLIPESNMRAYRPG
jgi:glycosyltransferase involved in cell wall biosynthesis